MPSPELERLVEAGLLHREAPIRIEFEGLVREAALTLRDAANPDLSPESRFRLAYGAAHAIALAALRREGYRPQNRQVVFQALAHTLDAQPGVWRMLAKTHQQRNRMEYEGLGEVDERLLADVIAAARRLLDTLLALAPPSSESDIE